MAAGIKHRSPIRVQIRTITLKFVAGGKAIYWFISIAIDLFRLSILFSQNRSCDDTQECIFIPKLCNLMLARSLFDEHDKG